MKKKIFGALVVVAIVVGAMINVNLNKVSNKGDLALANVEALANETGPKLTVSCYYLWSNQAGHYYTSCYSCKPQYNQVGSWSGTCEIDLWG